MTSKFCLCYNGRRSPDFLESPPMTKTTHYSRYLAFLRMATVVVTFLGLPWEVWGARQGDNKAFFSLDIGPYFSNLDRRFVAPAGYDSKVSHIGFFLRLRPGFPIGKSYNLQPSVALSYPWSGGADGSNRFFRFQWDLDLGIRLFKFLSLRFGPGLHWIFMVPSGERITLNNGTSSSDFYTPALVTNSYTLTAQAGFGIPLGKKKSLCLDVILLHPGSRSRRTVHGLISLGLIL